MSKKSQITININVIILTLLILNTIITASIFFHKTVPSQNNNELISRLNSLNDQNNILQDRIKKIQSEIYLQSDCMLNIGKSIGQVVSSSWTSCDSDLYKYPGSLGSINIGFPSTPNIN